MVSLSTFAPPRVGGLALRAKGPGMRSWLPTWRRTPFTIVYLTLIAAGTVVLSLLDDGDHDAVLRTSSTDVHHLSTHPIFVLVTSAVWVDGIVDGLLAVLVLGILATILERRVGTRWVVAIFASGHVGATLLTEGAVALGVYLGVLPSSAVSRIDVGASYGLAALLGATAGLLPRRVRITGVVGAWIYLGWPIVNRFDMTSWGHVLALAIGVCWWPWLQRHATATSTARGVAVRPETRHDADVIAMMDRWWTPRSQALFLLRRRRSPIRTLRAALSFSSTTTTKARSVSSSTGQARLPRATSFRSRTRPDGQSSSASPRSFMSVGR
jgi:rhomboid family protein